MLKSTAGGLHKEERAVVPRARADDQVQEEGRDPVSVGLRLPVPHAQLPAPEAAERGLGVDGSLGQAVRDALRTLDGKRAGGADNHVASKAASGTSWLHVAFLSFFVSDECGTYGFLHGWKAGEIRNAVRKSAGLLVAP